MEKKIYLDYNATTPLASEVLEEIFLTLKLAWANPSSCCENGLLARRIIEKSRKQVADMISADAREITFTSGGTESNNLILHTAVKKFAFETQRRRPVGSSLTRKETGEGPGALPHIISSDMEHDSIQLALHHLSEAGMADVSLVPSLRGSGCVDIDKIFSSIHSSTCLITVMLANNETGIIQPVKEIGRRLLEVNRVRALNGLSIIYFHTDAAQAIGKIPVDVNQLNVHYLTIVGHKFYGPRIGAVFARDAPLVPILFGGGQERNIRPGTENTGMIAGLGRACELVTLNLAEYEETMRKVRDHLERQLERSFPGRVHFNGKFPGSERLPNTCNISILGPKLKGKTVLSSVKCFESSVGAACHSGKASKPSPILMSIGIPEDVAVNAMRLSCGRETSIAEVERVVCDLKETVAALESNFPRDDEADATE